MLEQELGKQQAKTDRQTLIYTNFIKSVINLFDEFDLKNEESKDAAKQRRSTVIRGS